MRALNRRSFFGQAASLASAACLFGSRPLQASSSKRKFTMELSCGPIGVRADQREAIRLARQGGFESVAPSASELAQLSDAQLQGLLELLRDAGLAWGAAGLPLDFRGDESTFRSGLEKLPVLAAGLQRAGVTRVGTWLRPSHNELTYRANFDQHASRLREAAKVLDDHGQRFGLEYVGPKTSWTAGRFPFIHTMVETKELIAEIGCGNVGFMLDSWHWYTAGETEADLLSLRNEDVVCCHLNDAPTGIAVDEQMDNHRELPAATGVIDLAAFLGALVQIGYDGPVRAEPFDKELRALENEPAVAATAAAMRKAIALVE